MMSTDPHGHDADEHNEGVDHEHSDVDVRSILSFGAGIVVTVAVCAVIVLVMFGIMEGQSEDRDPVMSPVARPAGQAPPEPMLLTNEPANLSKFRAQETKALEGYGWVDQAGGVAHVPIGEAKKLLLQRGLPVRGVAAAPLAGTHVHATGESSSGRTLSTAPLATPGAPPAPAPAPAHPPAGEPGKAHAPSHD